VIDNTGTIAAAGHMENDTGGTLSNSGTIVALQTFANMGILNTSGDFISTAMVANLSPGTFVSTGRVALRSGLLINTGTVFNKSGQFSSAVSIDNAEGHFFSRGPVSLSGPFDPAPGDLEHGALLYFTVAVAPPEARSSCRAAGTAGQVPSDPEGAVTYVPLGGRVDLEASCRDETWKLAGWTMTPVTGHPFSPGRLVSRAGTGTVVEDVTAPFAAVANFARPVPPGPTPDPTTPPPGPEPGPTTPPPGPEPGPTTPGPEPTPTATAPTPLPAGAARIKAAQTKVVLIRGKSMRVPAAAYIGAKKAAKVTFTSSAPKVAKVTKKGKITAKRPGRATITIKAQGAKSVKITVNVLPNAAAKAKVTRAKAKGVPKTMTVGRVAWAAGSYAPARAPGIKITYRSSAKRVATIDPTGRIIARAKGKTTITIKAGPKTKKYRLTIR
jgi:hypothetical protein